MAMATKMQCAAEVWPKDRWPHPHPCRTPASIERDGKWWCVRHDPKAVAARSQVQADKYNAETQTVAERYRRAAAYTELVTALKALLEDEDEPGVPSWLTHAPFMDGLGCCFCGAEWREPMIHIDCPIAAGEALLLRLKGG